MNVFFLKRAITTSLVCVLFWQCNPKLAEVFMYSTFHEPADEGLRLAYSYDGITWTALDTTFLNPLVGGGKVMRDPSIVRDKEGTFHLVWTAGWRDDLGFGYASSKNLMEWSEQKFIPVMEYDTSTVNVWAPELYYDEDEDQFIVLWASTIPFKFEKGIEEERNNHRMYYTVTKDFETFTETQLFFDPGFSVIDAVIVKRGDHDFVLVLKDNTRPNRNLKVAFAENPLGPWSKVSEPFSGNFMEGPTVLRLENEWFIFTDAYREKRFAVYSTDDFQHFEDVSSTFSIPEKHKHGTIFKADEEILDGLKKFAEK